MGRRFFWVIVFVLVFLFLFVFPVPASAIFQVSLCDVMLESPPIISINGQNYAIGPTPPISVSSSALPPLNFTWVRQIGVTFQNISSEPPVVYVGDTALWTIQSFDNTSGNTTVTLQLTSPDGSTCGYTIGVDSKSQAPNTILSVYQPQVWNLSSTISGSVGAFTLLFPLNVTSISSAVTTPGDWKISIGTSGGSGPNFIEPFYIRALGIENFTVSPSTITPPNQQTFITANIVGLPLPPDPGAWTPSSVNWTLSIAPAAGGPAASISGSGLSLSETYDGSVPFGSLNKFFPPGQYDVDLTANDPVENVGASGVASLTIGGPTGVQVTITPSKVKLSPSFQGKPIDVEERNQTTFTIHAANCDGTPLSRPVKFVFRASVPKLASPPTQKNLNRRGGHTHSLGWPLGTFTIGGTSFSKTIKRGDGVTFSCAACVSDDSGSLTVGYRTSAVSGTIRLTVVKVIDTVTHQSVPFCSSSAETGSPASLSFSPIKPLGSIRSPLASFSVAGFLTNEILEVGAGICSTCHPPPSPIKKPSAEIDVEVPGFILLPDDPSLYIKDGGTPVHPGPLYEGEYTPGYPGIDTDHWGYPPFVKKIHEIINIYKNIGYSSTRVSLPGVGDTETVYVNDMSLPLGGLFDIGPPYGQYWHPPHGDHRTGRAADIQQEPFPLHCEITAPSQQELYDIIKKFHLHVYKEGPSCDGAPRHWHVWAPVPGWSPYLKL